MPPQIKKVETKRSYHHVTFRYAGQFETLRTLPDGDGRTKAARTISKGAKVRTGRTKRGGNWYTQSILIRKKYRSQADAKRLASKIITKIEERSG